MTYPLDDMFNRLVSDKYFERTKNRVRPSGRWISEYFNYVNISDRDRSMFIGRYFLLVQRGIIATQEGIFAKEKRKAC